MRPAILVVVAAAIVLAGCSAPPPASPPSSTPPSTPPPAASPPPTHAFIATDYAFTGPASVAGGWVTLKLLNQGQEPHELALMRIVNHTYAEFQQVLQAAMAPPADPNATQDPPPEWVVEYGGVGAVGPGGTAEVTQMLPPGTYAVLCFVPAPDGAPHVAHGMVRELTVTAGPAAMPELPSADVQLTMDEYSFAQQPDPPVAGHSVVRVRNSGDEPHQTQLFGLQGNFTVQQLLAFFGEGEASNETAPPPSGPPPFAVLGGVTTIPAGQEAYFPMDLEPGRYVYICFFHGHFAQGMVKEFTVA